jgi:hypothetical protein
MIYGDERRAYLELVKEALNAEKEEFGFIDYYSSNRSAKHISLLIEEANQYVEKAQYSKAIPIFQAIIQSVVPIIAKANASNAGLFDCSIRSFDGLAKITEKISGSERDELLNYCLKEALKKHYWGWAWDFARLAANLLVTSEERNKVFAFLDKLADLQQSKNGETAWFELEYNHQAAETIKAKVLKRLDSSEDYEKFLKSQLNLDNFQEALVLFYIEKGNLDEAKALANEFLPRAKGKEFEPRLQALLLQIAQQERNKNEILRLSKSLFIDGEGLSYYEIFKQNIADSEWPQFLSQLLEELERRYRPRLIADIYAREAMWNALINFMQEGENRWLVDPYRDELEKRFAKEISAIYEIIATEIVDQYVDRKGYQVACVYLRRMQKLGETARVKAIIMELRAKYSKRSALLDELDKL